MKLALRHAPLGALFLLSASAAFGVGLPDPDFGDGGYVLLPFDLGGVLRDSAEAVAIDAQGRIVVGGIATKESGGESDSDFAFARLLPDGSLDTSFGSGGRRTVAFDLGGQEDELIALAIDGSGRIVAAGTADTVGAGGIGDVALARLNSNGNLDAGFGIGGRVVLRPDPDALEGNATTIGLALQADGKLLVSANVLRSESPLVSDCLVLRLNADGSPDTAFGENGVASVDASLGQPFNFCSRLALAPDDGILLAGSTDAGNGIDVDFDMFVARFDPQGQLDLDFGEQGVRRIAFNEESGRGLALDASGRVVVAGLAHVGPDQNIDMLVLRLRSEYVFSDRFE